MKKLLSIIVIATSSVAFIACSNEKKTDESYDEYRSYVIEHRDRTDAYYDKEWSELERNYNEKRMNAEAKMDKWDDKMRAEYASLQSDWESFREDYRAERERRDMVAQNEGMINNLLPPGISKDLSNVTSENLLAVHTHFVNYIEVNKDQMSREQWDRVDVIWEALGTKKNELEKNLPSGDNLKIAEQKIKYGAYKAANVPTAKAEEKDAVTGE